MPEAAVTKTTVWLSSLIPSAVLLIGGLAALGSQWQQTAQNTADIKSIQIKADTANDKLSEMAGDLKEIRAIMARVEKRQDEIHP